MKIKKRFSQAILTTVLLTGAAFSAVSVSAAGLPAGFNYLHTIDGINKYSGNSFATEEINGDRSYVFKLNEDTSYEAKNAYAHRMPRANVDGAKAEDYSTMFHFRQEDFVPAPRLPEQEQSVLVTHAGRVRGEFIDVKFVIDKLEMKKRTQYDEQGKKISDYEMFGFFAPNYFTLYENSTAAADKSKHDLAVKMTQAEKFLVKDVQLSETFLAVGSNNTLSDGKPLTTTGAGAMTFSKDCHVEYHWEFYNSRTHAPLPYQGIWNYQNMNYVKESETIFEVPLPTTEAEILKILRDTIHIPYDIDKPSAVTNSDVGYKIENNKVRFYGPSSKVNKPNTKFSHVFGQDAPVTFYKQGYTKKGSEGAALLMYDTETVPRVSIATPYIKGLNNTLNYEETSPDKDVAYKDVQYEIYQQVGNNLPYHRDHELKIKTATPNKNYDIYYMEKPEQTGLSGQALADYKAEYAKYDADMRKIKIYSSDLTDLTDFFEYQAVTRTDDKGNKKVTGITFDAKKNIDIKKSGSIVPNGNKDGNAPEESIHPTINGKEVIIRVTLVPNENFEKDEKAGRIGATVSKPPRFNNLKNDYGYDKDGEITSGNLSFELGETTESSYSYNRKALSGTRKSKINSDGSSKGKSNYNGLPWGLPKTNVVIPINAKATDVAYKDKADQFLLENSISVNTGKDTKDEPVTVSYKKFPDTSTSGPAQVELLLTTPHGVTETVVVDVKIGNPAPLVQQKLTLNDVELTGQEVEMDTPINLKNTITLSSPKAGEEFEWRKGKLTFTVPDGVAFDKDKLEVKTNLPGNPLEFKTTSGATDRTIVLEFKNANDVVKSATDVVVTLSYKSTLNKKLDDGTQETFGKTCTVKSTVEGDELSTVEKKGNFKVKDYEIPDIKITGSANPSSVTPLGTTAFDITATIGNTYYTQLKDGNMIIDLPAGKFEDLDTSKIVAKFNNGNGNKPATATYDKNANTIKVQLPANTTLTQGSTINITYDVTVKTGTDEGTINTHVTVSGKDHKGGAVSKEKDIALTIGKGTLKFVKVSDADFGIKPLIAGSARDIAPTTPMEISYMDTRSGTNNIKITAAVESGKEMKAGSDKLKGYLYIVEFGKDKANQVDQKKLGPTPVKIYTGTSQSNGTINFEANKSGLFLKQKAGNMKKTYEGTVTWTIDDAP